MVGGFRGEGCVRSSICVEQDVSVFQLLRVGALLEVFLEGVLADVGGGADGGYGRFVDDGCAALIFGCHDCFICLWRWCLYGDICLDCVEE